MKSKILPVVFMLFTITMLKAQPPETIYPGTVVREGYYDDGAWGPFNIGFSFTFYGNAYSQFYVTSNGLVMFGGFSGDYTEDPIPSGSSPNNFIAAFWDDIVIDPSGKILYTTVGAAPNRKCIIQWTNMGFYASSVLMGTFSVILYEGSNDIQIQYRSIIDNLSARSHGSSATIGIENSTGSAGVPYAYHNSSAVSSELAISFSPSGSTYTLNPSATYDGVYLTKNIGLPEPGIPTLVSPPNNSTIGSSQKFEWTSATNATSYTLKISNNSDISGSTDHDAGTSTSFDITGLTLNATYFWAVFASNSTGTTWSEIKRFYTSANPPLTPVPQTIWMEQNEERTIKLQYNGGDAGVKTGIITSLPAEGNLFQYNGGEKGSMITAVPATVTDPQMNIIYEASGATGNGAGSFNFLIQDGTGDSPEALVTINVNAPGVPNFLLAAKSGNIEIQFDKPMSDPTGKESQFTVKVNGIIVPISSVSLKDGDPYTISVVLASPLTGSEAVLISYTQGDVSSEAGGLLSSFVDQPVNFLIQTINFPALPEMTYGDAPLTLSASSSAGLPVTYTSSNTSVATLSGNILTANSTGTSLITAQQVGDGTYAPAKYIRTLTVNKGEQTITFPALPSKTFGDTDFNPGATASSGLQVTYASDNPDVALISSGNIHITGAGTANITASQVGNTLYNAAPDIIVQLAVAKADQTITFEAPPAMQFNDPDFNPAATASSGLTVAYSSNNISVATVSGNLIHIVAPGTAVITASQPGNDDYNAAPEVNHTLTVGKDDQTITFDPLQAVTFGDPDLAPGATASSALTVSYSSGNTGVAQIVAGMINIVGAGNAVITATQAGNEFYNPAPEVQQTLTVGKASQSVTFPEIPPALYGDPDIDPQATASSGLPVSYSSSDQDVAQISDGLIHITGAGTVTITALQPGNINYLESAPVSTILNIGKASQTITLPDPGPVVYGDPDFEIQVSSSSGLPVICSGNNPLVAVITDNVLHITGAGTVTITASQSGNNNYEPAQEVTLILTVEKSEQTITFNPFGEFKFGDPDIIPSASSSSSLPLIYSSNNPDVATVISGHIVITGAGTAIITASQTGDDNYAPAEDVSQTLDVAKAGQIITFNPLPVAVYGDDTVVPDVLSTSGLGITLTSSNTSVALISEGKIVMTGAGTAEITASQEGDNNYNPAEEVTVSFTVNKADQTITFPAIDPVVYGIAPFSPVATSTSGLDVFYSSDNTDVAEIINGTLLVRSTGEAVITATQEGDDNFNAAAGVTSTLTVTKAILTFSADDAIRPFNAPNPEFTYTITGFVYDDAENVLDELPVLTTEATVSSPVGDYDIIVSGGSDNCYDYEYSDGLLTITKISQSITVTDSPEELLMNDTYLLVAESTSGLPVMFESLNNSVADLSGSVMTGRGAGVVTLRAYSDGNENYNPAETTFEVTIISTHRDIMNLFTPNNDGFNDYWEIPALDTWGKCEVKVYNRWGKLVFHSPDYHNEWNGLSDGTPVPSAAYYYIINSENAGVITGTVNIVR